MIKDDIIKVKTCVLKVGIHCPACVKQVKKIAHKVDGVYQSTVERDGKVTVSGLMDPDMVIRKLKKAGKSAQLWGPEPQMGSHQPQKAQLGSSSGGDQQPKDGGKGQGNAGADARSSGESRGAANDAIPQATPQQLLRQQIMKELMLPSQPKGMSSKGKTSLPTAAAPPPVQDSRAFKFNDPEEEEEEFEDDGEFDDGFEGEDFEDDDDDGLLVDNDAAMPIAMPPTTLAANKRGSGTNEIPVVQAKGKAKIAGQVVPAVKPNLQGSGGRSNAKNGGSVQPPSNGKAASALGGGNKPGLANKVGGTSGLTSGVGGMPPQQPAGMMPRPPYMMGGGSASYPGMLGMPMGHPHMVGNGMQPAGGGGGSAAVHGMMPGAGGFCQGGASGGGVAGGMPSGPEQYMSMVPQQQPQMMMMNGHCPHGYHCHHVHGGGGYPPAYYPPTPRHPHDNMFSDENPNSYCSLM